MTSHPLDDLQQFVLGDLDRDDAAAVLAHADTCSSCAAELADMMRGVAALAQAEGERGESGSVDAATARRSTIRVGRSAASEAKVVPSSRWVAGLATAAVVLLGVWDIQMRATMPAVPADAIVNSHFTHHPLTGQGGGAKILCALDGSWVYVVADHLRPLGRYHVDVDGATLGDVRAGLDGTATAYFVRGRSPITSASLNGNGTALRWSGH